MHAEHVSQKSFPKKILPLVPVSKNPPSHKDLGLIWFNYFQTIAPELQSCLKRSVLWFASARCAFTFKFCTQIESPPSPPSRSIVLVQDRTLWFFWCWARINSAQRTARTSPESNASPSWKGWWWLVVVISCSTTLRIVGPGLLDLSTVFFVSFFFYLWFVGEVLGRDLWFLILGKESSVKRD